MFNIYAHVAIDAIQDSKKKFVDTFVLHDGIKKALNGFVDAQTKYTKSAVDAGTSAASNIGSIVTDKKFIDDLAKAVKSYNPLKG